MTSITDASMSAGRKTRPGMDRIAGQLLNATISTYADMLIQHGNRCVTCKQAGTDALKHCDSWWMIKTELHKLQRQKRFRESGIIPGQQELPGIEQR